MNEKISNTRIDKCMKFLILNLNASFKKPISTVACCCGHGKYPMTIIVRTPTGLYDLVSSEVIHRRRNLYERDKQGYYFLRESVN